MGDRITFRVTAIYGDESLGLRTILEHRNMLDTCEPGYGWRFRDEAGFSWFCRKTKTGYSAVEKPATLNP